MKFSKKIMSLFLSCALLCLCACSSGSPASPYDGMFGEKSAATNANADSTTVQTAEGTPEGTTAQEGTTAPGSNAVTTPSKTTSSGEKRCVAYFTSWSAYARNVTVGNIDPTLLTHINFAFANLNNNGEIVIGDSWVDVEKPFGGESWEAPNDSRGHFSALRELKKNYPHIRTLISVGGWTWSKNFSDAAASDAGRETFAKSAAAFVSKYGFDGVDIDWEFPVEGGDNITHRPEDKQNYTLLLAKTREALDAQGQTDGKHYLLTIAGGPNVSFAKNTELTEMMKYLDFINVMTYDYHGGWENVTNHNAPLYANPNDPTEFKDYCVEGTINAYLETGLSPADLNLGLAFYGRGWTEVTSTANNGLWQSGKAATATGYGLGTWEGACFDYWDLIDNYVGQNGYTRYFDDVAKVPYLYNGSAFISYDDAESIRAKLEFADAKGLGGAMFWEFSGDKKMELQKVLADYYGIAEQAAQAQPVTDAPSSDASSPAQTGGSEWDSSATYNGGDTVAYQGKTFRAKWWTQGETPDASKPDGPWELVS